VGEKKPVFENSVRVTYKFFNPLTRKGDFDKFAATSPEKIRQTNAF
jgi:hypothetical protein